MPEKKRRSVRPITPVVLDPAQIAQRAYLRWMDRGCPISDGREDWFAAQAELERESVMPSTRARKGAPTAARLS